MQIVIDIPQGLKIDFENENWTALTCAEMKNALINGTPLEKIRDEILKLDDPDYDFEGYYKAVTDALAIIDKYRGNQNE